MGRLALRPGLRAYAHAGAAPEDAWENAYALALNGTDQYATGTSDLPTWGVNGWSVSMWIRFPDTTSNANFDTFFWIGPNDKVRLAWSTNAASQAIYMIQRGNASNAYLARYIMGTYEKPSNDIGWHFLCVTSDTPEVDGVPSTNGLVGYCDNTVLADTGPYNWAGSGAISSVVIGARGTGSICKVEIDEVAWWNKELSSSEVGQVKNSKVISDLSSLSFFDANCEHWWRMGDLTDDASTIYDRVGSCNLTTTGTPTLITTVLPARVSTKSVSLDGADESAMSASEALFNGSDTNYSISFWEKGNETAINDILAINADGDGDGDGRFRIRRYYATFYFYEGSNDGSEAFINSRRSGADAYPHPGPSGEIWYHVVCTSNTAAGSTTNSLNIYVGGILCGTGNGTAWASPTGTQRVIFGRNAASSTWYKGSVDSITMWNTELDQGEVEAIFNLGRPGDVTALDGSGSTPDYSANCVHHYKMGDGDPAGFGANGILDSKGSAHMSTTNMDADNLDTDSP